MVPHDTIIEAADAQAAHNEATRMLNRTQTPQDATVAVPTLHSIEEMEEVQIDLGDFPPPPEAA